MQYRKEIDGLRSVAVLPVILFHAGFNVFSGGYVGVDVFFVISGYLITSILISDLERGKFSIARFYERRARRILPALFVVMFACLPFAWIWMIPSELKDFAQSLIAVVIFVSNILFWREEGYFAPTAELKPLLHTWSLAVEEQYYLIFPVFLFLMWRFGRDRVFWSIAFIAAASLALSELGWRYEPSANFYLAPPRAWELLAGSLSAFYLSGRPQRASNVLSGAGLALIIFAVFYYDDKTPFPSLYALAPVLGTALIILFAGEKTVVARLLSGPPFVGIGLISYSAYLWHQPLFAFARMRSLAEPSQLLMIALAVLSLLLAWLTWRFVENPFRLKSNPLLASRRSIFAASGAAGAVFIAVGLAGHLQHGFVNRMNPHVTSALETAKLNSPVFIAKNRYDNRACIFSVAELSREVEERIVNCANSNGSGILVIGDSHATNLFHSVVRSGFEIRHNFLVGITSNGCHLPVLLEKCPYNDILGFVQHNPDVFSNIIYEKAGFLMLNKADRWAVRHARFGDPEIHIDKDLVAGVTAWLRGLAAVAPVTWYGPRLDPLISEREIYLDNCRGDLDLGEGQRDLYLGLDRYLGELLSGESRISYISQIKSVGFNYPEDLGDCDNPYWMDMNHFSVLGEERFGRRFDLLGAVLH